VIHGRCRYIVGNRLSSPQVWCAYRSTPGTRILSLRIVFVVSSYREGRKKITTSWPSRSAALWRASDGSEMRQTDKAE